MENKIILYALFVLYTLMNIQYAYGQDTSCPEVIGYSIAAYDEEITRRLNTLQNIDIDLETTYDQEGEVVSRNYVILNDRDFYGACGNGCKWPYIDACYGNPDFNINDITYFILTPGDYRDYLTFKPCFHNGDNPDTPNDNDDDDEISSADDIKYLLHYPLPIPNEEDFISNNEDDIELYLNGSHTEIPFKAAAEQAEHERAIIENFHFYENSWSWVVRGITIRGNHNSRLDDENFILGTGSSTSTISSDNNIIEGCLFENQVVGNFLYIVNGSSNIIHDCVIRDMNDCMITYLAGNDIIGITIGATGVTEARNNVILNNEIYNVTDAVQLIRHEGTNLTGDMPGTLIYDNEMYNTKVYTDNCGEERMNGEGAIDIKQGTGTADVRDSIGNKIIIANNLFYGWRRSGTEGLGREFYEDVLDDDGDGITDEYREKDCINLFEHPIEGDCEHVGNGRGGGAGEAITTHTNANNIAIINNRVSDCSNGFLIGTGGQIEIYNNTICNLYPPNENYVDSYWDPASTNFQYNILQGDHCILRPDGLGGTTDEYNYEYTVGHGIGEAMRISIPSCIVSGNRIKGAIYGIRLDGVGQKALVTGNYINDIYKEDFYPIEDCSFANFSGNTYYDFTNVCWGGDSDSPPSDSVIINNCFLDCNGNKMGVPFDCSAQTQTDCN